MRRFQRRNNSFGLRQQLASIERFGVGCADVFRSPTIFEPRVLRTDGRVIQSRRNRLRGRDLPGFILQHVRVCALQNSRHSSAKTRSMIAQRLAASASLDTDQLYFFIANKVVKNSDRIRSAANACNDRHRQLAFSFHDLRPRLAPNHSLEIAHHRGIRVSAQHAAQQIMRAAHIGHPGRSQLKPLDRSDYSVTFTDATHITVNITVGNGVATGSRIVTITNPDGQNAASASGHAPA